MKSKAKTAKKINIRATPRTAVVPPGLRRLRWDELVSQGDYQVHAQRGLELWDGPSGFRASSFIQPIFRQQGSRGRGNKPAE